MPELPEIENLAFSLRPRLVGRQIVDLRCRQPKMLNLPVEEFAERVRYPIAEVRRRGKYCVLRLSQGSVWLHLGLGGVVQLGAPPEKEPQLAFVLDDGAQLSLDRTFMGNAHYFAETDFPARWAAFGPEPTEPGFDLVQLRAILAAKPRQALKPLLMDQARVAGIGNVYSDEILHAARLHPGRQAASLQAEELAALYGAVKDVLSQASAAGGEPEYKNLDGQPGRYPVRIHGAKECPTCAGPIEQSSLGGRTGYYCKKCQK